MNNKNPLYIVISLVVGFAIGTGLTCSFGAMKSFKAPEQRAITIKKHKAGLTLQKLSKQVERNTIEIKKLKQERNK